MRDCTKNEVMREFKTIKFCYLEKVICNLQLVVLLIEYRKFFQIVYGRYSFLNCYKDFEQVFQLIASNVLSDFTECMILVVANFSTLSCLIFLNRLCFTLIFINK